MKQKKTHRITAKEDTGVFPSSSIIADLNRFSDAIKAGGLGWENNKNKVSKGGR